MKCFYCAEEIRDEAIVCRFCGRDLHFLRPFIDKLTTLELRVDELSSALAMFHHRDRVELEAVPAAPDRDVPAAARPVARGRNPRRRVAIAGTLAAIATSMMVIASENQLNVWFYLTLVAPFPFGAWAGFGAAGRHFRRYALAGFAAGTVVFFVAGAVAFGGVTRIPMVPRTILGFLIYAMGPCMVFTTGALVAERIGSWISIVRRGGDWWSTPPRQPLRFQGAGGAPMAAGGVSSIAELVNSLAPLLTFMGSVVTSYLTYRAAIGK